MVTRKIGSKYAALAMRDENDRKRFQPANSRDFPLASMIEAESLGDKNRTRGIMTYVLVGILLISLTYAAIMSTVTGDFSHLRNIWAIAGPFVGAMVAYYFRHDQKEHP